MKELIGIELKRNINRTTLVILVFSILSVLFINYSGVKRIKGLENTKDEFTKNEIQKVESYYSYRQYGWAGFSFLFFPSPVGVIFNSSNLNNLQSASNMGFKFDISNPKKGKHAFNARIGLTWFLLIIGGGLSIAFGWLALRNREFIKTLLNTGSKFFVYFSIITARIILIFLLLCVLTICLFAQSYIMGINLTDSEIAIINIMLITFAVMIFFLLTGAILGTIKSASKSGIITFREEGDGALHFDIFSYLLSP